MDISQTPTREVLWNITSTWNVILMYGAMCISLVVAGAGVFRHAEIWAGGKSEPENKESPLKRASHLIRWGLFQKGVVREKAPALIHTLIYFGFLVLLFTTTMVFIDHDLGIRIYNGDFYLWVTIFSDIFGFGLLVGCALAAHRRYIRQAPLLHSKWSDSFFLIMLSLLVVQGFVIEALRIHATEDPWRAYSPVGNIISRAFWGLSLESTKNLHFAVWWFHTLTVFVFIALLPYTKFFHVVSSSANLFFRNLTRPKGKLPFPGDLEKLMEGGEEFSIGLGSIKDYTWKNLLDLDACTSCGRCQDNCPAYLSGKPLSPKWIVLDSRNHTLALAAKGELSPTKLPAPLAAMDRGLTNHFLLPSLGLHKNGEAFHYAGLTRGANQAVQNAALKIGGGADDLIAGDVIDPMAFWSCTTCMACVEACPVEINHVDQIVGNRRNLALMRGEIPSEAQPTLRALENRGNPYGPPEDRANWLTDLDVPVLNPGDAVDYLYWVGCVSAYDPRKQKIARALVTLMKRAGLSFGVLGTAEGCTGDPARRLGEENLFQTLAKQNAATLSTIKFKNLVANCPHCFNTIKNEYPDFGGLGEGRKPRIIHHSQLLKELLASGQLKTKDSAESYTFHDPCYLGRYNEEYDAPRETLRSSPSLKILEMERSREKGLCCGAGGGHFWMDLKIGQRINAIRVDEAASTGANNIATACPFCMQMMEDGVKITNREDKMRVRDIAEVVLENLA